MNSDIDSPRLTRWCVAKSLTLGSLLLAGTMAFMAQSNSKQSVNARAHCYSQNLVTYSGIGIKISRASPEDNDDLSNVFEIFIVDELQFKCLLPHYSLIIK